MMLSRTLRFLSSNSATFGGAGGVSLAFGSRARSVSPLPPDLPSSFFVAVFFGFSGVFGAAAPVLLGSLDRRLRLRLGRLLGLEARDEVVAGQRARARATRTDWCRRRAGRS